jgi:hypothetical protein
MPEAVRLTVSLPKDKALLVREKARSKKVTISRYLGECVDRRVAEDERLLMIEGYKARSQEHREFARLAEDAARELLDKPRSH